MNTRTFHVSIALLSALLAACGERSAPIGRPPSTTAASPSDPRAAATIRIWQAHVDTLDGRVAQLESLVRTLDAPEAVMGARHAFAAARTTFKQVEIGLEYYFPSTTRGMNGPALPEVEETEGPETVLEPTGFQVIEEALYGDDPRAEQEPLVAETGTLREIVTRARTMIAPQQTTDAHVWDAAKLELARIVTLGLPGFDSPVAERSIVEADAALEGIERSLAPYADDSVAWAEFVRTLQQARRTLQSDSNRTTFDHFGFIVHHAQPLARALQAARAAMHIGIPRERRAFAMAAASIFDSAAIDVMAFAPLDADSASEQRIALGRRLFADTRLSGDGQRACVSCHQPERAFTDGLRVNRARGGTPLARNTPTVINSGVQVGVFSDLRTTYLEDQVTDVVENVDEMHGSLAAIAVRLGTDPSVAAQFRAAFGAQSDSVVTPARIRTALAAYQRSLTRLDSRVDRALRGDSSTLTADERAGFNVFVGKGKCATCHFLPLTNGTVPPMFQKSEVEVLGTPREAATRAATVDPDVGRFRLTRAEPHRHAFRTPSLRNVALTAPYMHNGAYPTLESVIDFYNRGGGAGIGVRLNNQTLPPDRLDLTPSEQRRLVAFLRALTDTAGLSSKPTK